MAETILGFDYGRRRIGVAVGETLAHSTRPLTALHARRDGGAPWEQIETLVAQWRPARIVVGLPRHLDGREAPLAAEVRNFAAELTRRTGCPVEFGDEALSTEAARARLAGSRRGRRDQARDRLNAEAAREILAAWLEEAGNA